MRADSISNTPGAMTNSPAASRSFRRNSVVMRSRSAGCFRGGRGHRATPPSISAAADARPASSDRWSVVAPPRLFPRQEIADLGEQHLLARRGRRWLLHLFVLEAIDSLDDQEQCPGDDQETDADRDEIAPGEHCA